MTIYMGISVVFAFFIPILSAMIIQEIVDEKPYTVPLIAVSLFSAFIVATLCLYAQ